MCDGTVRFMTNSMQLATWRAIFSTQGNETVTIDY
jgi:hypothetical protein